MPNKRYNKQVPGFKDGGKVLKPVDKNLKTNPINQWHVESPNAWYIHMAIGKVKDFIGQAPYSLPYVGWMRATKDHPIRWYDFNKIQRRK